MIPLCFGSAAPFERAGGHKRGHIRTGLLAQACPDTRWPRAQGGARAGGTRGLAFASQACVPVWANSRISPAPRPGCRLLQARSGGRVGERRGALLADDGRRLMDEVVVLEGLDHEECEVHA